MVLFNIWHASCFQVDYILGKNPLGMSYMVGFSTKFPRRIHHRGSSIPSIKVLSRKVTCKEGFSSWLPTSDPNHQCSLCGCLCCCNGAEAGGEAGGACGQLRINGINLLEKRDAENICKNKIIIMYSCATSMCEIAL